MEMHPSFEAAAGDKLESSTVSLPPYGTVLLVGENRELFCLIWVQCQPHFELERWINTNPNLNLGLQVKIPVWGISVCPFNMQGSDVPTHNNQPVLQKILCARNVIKLR